MTQSIKRARSDNSGVTFKPSELSFEDFIRQEIEYYDRQAAKTRDGLSEHLRRMHAFYLGLARHRRQQLAGLPESRVPGARGTDAPRSRIVIQ